jgi:hypothetical protein
MSDSAALERRYRRLIACYPAKHRGTYGEEMVGVLLASAAPGQRRPGLADTIDVIAGAWRVRLRGALTAAPDAGWRDALAVTSLIAPLLLIVLALGQNLGWLADLLWHSLASSPGVLRVLLGPISLLIPLALGLLGLRRTAALATAILMPWVTVQAALGDRLQEPRFAAYLVLLAVQALALTASPGLRAGLRLLSGKAIVLTIPWLAATACAGQIVPTHYPVPLVTAQLAIAVVVLSALPSLLSARGRRLLVLLVAIPGSAFAASVLSFAGVDFSSMSFAAAQVAMYLPPALLSLLALLAIRRSRGEPPTIPAGAAQPEQPNPA